MKKTDKSIGQCGDETCNSLEKEALLGLGKHKELERGQGGDGQV